MNSAQAQLQMLTALSEAIRTAGRIPSGHLYALTMAAFSSVAAYESFIDSLVRTRLVAREGQVLVWTGPFAVQGGAAR